jgi:hypothetical protein
MNSQMMINTLKNLKEWLKKDSQGQLLLEKELISGNAGLVSLNETSKK